MRNGLFFTLSAALAAAGFLSPAPANAECYDPPAAYVVWQKCEFKRICADPKKEKRVNWCKTKGLDGANLKSAALETIVLHHSSLKGVNLENANLYEADLQYSDLTGANLKNAKLSKAKLQNAILRDADLSGANLHKANLEGADLTGAKLDGTKLSAVRMSGATWTDGKTKCKGGSVGKCIK